METLRKDLFVQNLNSRRDISATDISIEPSVPMSDRYDQFLVMYEKIRYKSVRRIRKDAHLPNQINYLLSTKFNTTSSKILPVLPPPIGRQTINPGMHPEK